MNTSQNKNSGSSFEKRGRKVLFIDRDGTIIEDKCYLNDPNDIVYFPKVFEALEMLRDLNFKFLKYV